ncbi:hypothetical protein T439DRAFT_320528 [Meredithblackwellia eburnea MCA 4105]
MAQTPPGSPDIAQQPTITFIIPFPEAPSSCTAKLPPFLLYAPLAAALKAPEEGEKEKLTKKVERKWQEEERSAKDAVSEGNANWKQKGIGFVSKAASWTKNSRVEFLNRTPSAANLKELKVIFPSSMPPDGLQDKFTAVLKAERAAAIRNGVIATVALPFVFVFDTLTFIPGPFELNTLYMVASWTGASRAASISNGVSSNKVAVSFLPDTRLEQIAHRLHQVCWENRKPEVPMEKPHWFHEDPPLVGVELAALVLALINVHLDLGACEQYERNLERLSQDLEDVLLKGAKEWLAAVA